MWEDFGGFFSRNTTLFVARKLVVHSQFNRSLEMVLDRKRKAVEGDANPVEEHKSKKTKHNAKDNVTLGVNNTLIISNKCADKIRKWSVSEEDPCFGLAWNDNAISDALRAVTNNQILGLPQVPAFLDTASV